MIDTIKKLPSVSGIYIIKSPNNLVYIGEAKNLKIRCRSYINPKNVKNQRAIYNSLIKYGVETHVLEILELCDKSKLLERERFYQDFYNSVSKGLNCYLTGTNELKKEWSTETKKIMSQNKKGEKNTFFGKRHTEESLKKISQSSKGENNPNFGGKFINEEYLKKQMDSNSKKPLKITDTLTNEVFYFGNSKQCSYFLNCSNSSVRMSKNKYKLKGRFIVEDDKKEVDLK